jgi:hypothetical protein
MNDRTMDRLADGAPARHSRGLVAVADLRNPGAAYVQAEIDSNRRFEWLLPLKALLALAFVLALVVIRIVYFG